MENPEVDDAVIHENTPVSNQFFYVSGTEGVGKRPTNTENHVVLKIATCEVWLSFESPFPRTHAPQAIFDRTHFLPSIKHCLLDSFVRGRKTGIINVTPFGKLRGMNTHMSSYKRHRFNWGIL